MVSPTHSRTTVDGVARSTATRLPIPEPGRWAAEEYVSRHLGHLVERRGSDTGPTSSPIHRGGQSAADNALRSLNLEGYASRGQTAYPQPHRAASGLSPWIRHGLLSLQQVWDSVAGGPGSDVAAFRTALLHQEYARHLYARLGSHLADLGPGRSDGHSAAGRRRTDNDDAGPASGALPGWDRRLGCVQVPLDELEEDGWVVGEGRRWLAAHWLEFVSGDWTPAEDHGHRHALDGSRAAGRVAWLEMVGALGRRATPHSRWVVEERAPGLCASCELVYDCPIERARDAGGAASSPVVDPPTTDARLLLAADPDLAATTGPLAPIAASDPEEVWITAESMGDADPALAAHPDLPAVFVFDEPLLRRLRLSPTRLAFLVETVADLGRRRRIDLWLGKPADVLAGRRLAATFTPVPGWKRLAAQLEIVATHPWPWLRSPVDSQIDSFSCWRAAVS